MGTLRESQYSESVTVISPDLKKNNFQCFDPSFRHKHNLPRSLAQMQRLIFSFNLFLQSVQKIVAKSVQCSCMTVSTKSDKIVHLSLCSHAKNNNNNKQITRGIKENKLLVNLNVMPCCHLQAWLSISAVEIDGSTQSFMSLRLANR